MKFEIEEGKKLQNSIISILNELKSEEIYLNKEEFTEKVKKTF